MQEHVIETERLLLRPHRGDDFAGDMVLWTDPDVLRFLGGKPSTGEEVWSRLLRYAGLWSILGYGYWAIEDRASGAFLGEVGFADFRREMVPALDAPELGWALVGAAHGRGLGTEAVRAALAWGDRHLAADRTLCIINPENAASLRVAEKVGYRPLGEPALYKERPVTPYARSRGER